MSASWTSESFPQFEKAIRRLTEQHRELEDEPLHLAVSYRPLREQEDIFLLEVIGSTWNSMGFDGDLFETTFNSTDEFPMGPDQHLHLILTNPQEMETALEEKWPLAMEIVDALGSKEKYKILFADKVGKRLLALLQERRPRRTVRG